MSILSLVLWRSRFDSVLFVCSEGDPILCFSEGGLPFRLGYHFIPLWICVEACCLCSWSYKMWSFDTGPPKTEKCPSGGFILPSFVVRGQIYSTQLTTKSVVLFLMFPKLLKKGGYSSIVWIMCACVCVCSVEGAIWWLAETVLLWETALENKGLPW